MTNVKLVPLENHVIVRAEVAENTSKAGIILPSKDDEKPSKWTVIAVGQGSILDNGQRWPMDVKVGDVVYFTKYSPDEIEVNENGEKTTYLVIKHSSILAKESK